MAEQVENEKVKCKKQLYEMSSQLGAAKQELAQAKTLEASLVEQQNHMSVEMAAEKKARDKSASELKRWLRFNCFDCVSYTLCLFEA